MSLQAESAVHAVEPEAVDETDDALWDGAPVEGPIPPEELVDLAASVQVAAERMAPWLSWAVKHSAAEFRVTGMVVHETPDGAVAAAVRLSLNAKWRALLRGDRIPRGRHDPPWHVCVRGYVRDWSQRRFSKGNDGICNVVCNRRGHHPVSLLRAELAEVVATIQARLCRANAWSELPPGAFDMPLPADEDEGGAA